MGVVGGQEVAAASLAGVAVSVLHALLVGPRRGEAAALEGSVHGAVAVADVALIAELVDGADGGQAVGLVGAHRPRRVAGALQALGAAQGEQVAVAALAEGAHLADQLVVARGAGFIVQISGTAADRVAICGKGKQVKFNL